MPRYDTCNTLGEIIVSKVCQKIQRVQDEVKLLFYHNAELYLFQCDNWSCIISAKGSNQQGYQGLLNDSNGRGKYCTSNC